MMDAAPAAASDVSGRAAEVAEVARGGAAWLEANRARLKEAPSALARDFRRFARRAARLQAAAARPMCVAVFGASQAGKSYLVSSLATKPGRPLTALYADQRLNFLQDLNPQGGKESTGLVSRFTVRGVVAPAAAPVPVRLLSQADVVKILANTYLEDFKVRGLLHPEPAAIAALFDRLAGQAGPVATGGLTVDDIEDLREYMDQELGQSRLIEALGPAYWARAADIVPRLPPALRAEAFAPLWNGTAAFTRVAQQLVSALEALGFPDTAFIGLDALIPRETSVLDADMVFGLGRGPARQPARRLRRRRRRDHRPGGRRGPDRGDHRPAGRAAVGLLRQHRPARLSRRPHPGGDHRPRGLPRPGRPPRPRLPARQGRLFVPAL